MIELKYPSTIRSEWRNAKTDPPTESGWYMTATYWRSCHHWYITDKQYSAQWGNWNCFDTADEQWAHTKDNEYVDFWMPMLPEPIVSEDFYNG